MIGVVVEGIVASSIVLFTLTPKSPFGSGPVTTLRWVLPFQPDCDRKHDLVILSDNPLMVDPMAIKDIKVIERKISLIKEMQTGVDDCLKEIDKLPFHEVPQDSNDYKT